MSSFNKIAFVSSGTDEANAALEAFEPYFGSVALENADVVVAFGGDGLMLETLHRVMNTGTPVYGLNFGSLGFLMNSQIEPKDLRERLECAETTIIHPLKMTVMDQTGRQHTGRAINEVSLWRKSQQAAKLTVSVDGRERMDELVCDGVMVATPAGSTAYNFSAHGPILPINARLLALTPISPFRPRRWRGALLPSTAKVTIDVINGEKRPVNVAADNNQILDVKSVTIQEEIDVSMLMMFDPGHSLEERILTEQFLA